MKKIILALLICGSLHTFAQKTNFSGTWTLNSDKTDFGKAPQWIIPKTIKVDQQADELALTRTSLDQDLKELPPVSYTLTFDGKPLDYKGNAITLSWPGNSTLHIDRKAAQSSAEDWTLEDDGKTLVIDRYVEQASGLKYEIKCYYSKS